MVLGAAWLVGGVSGCFSAEDAAAQDGSKASGATARASAERPRGEPQQVIVSNRAALGTAPAAEPSTGEAAAVSIGVPERRVRAEEPITSKHLEAELNRLEAELGR
jgi:hypothetical protein